MRIYAGILMFVYAYVILIIQFNPGIYVKKISCIGKTINGSFCKKHSLLINYVRFLGVWRNMMEDGRVRDMPK